MPRTATQRLVDIHLGRSLDGYVAERREAGESWRTIASSLKTATGLTVSHETLRLWYAEQTPADAA